MKQKIKYEDMDLPVDIFRWSPSTSREQQHYHHSFEIGLCESGSGRFYFGDKSYSIEQNDLFIVNHMEDHIAQSDPDDPARFIFIYFDPSLLQSEEPDLLMPFAYFPLRFRNRLSGDSERLEELRVLIRKLWEEQDRRSPGYRTAIKSHMLLLCVQLLRLTREEFQQEEWQRGARSYHFIRPVLQYIADNYQQELELKTLADMLSLSLSQTSRLIQEATGLKFKDYLLSHRIQHAKRMLGTTDASVTDICYACGFQSLATFYRSFARTVGMSPTVYRNRSQFAIDTDNT
ncbi:helix-turn-helix domain-containing protein [Paenibacillus sp. GCM10023252]|uniref:AraC family transcriptional regulator n=1 Tax=Paenibacillus sp. GCM10023252 TaxID=3252649 RepID=UPI00361B6E8C